MKRSPLRRHTAADPRAKTLGLRARNHAEALVDKLRLIWSPPEHGVFTEVNSGPTPYDVLRRADAIAVRLSGGTEWEIDGFEVKTTRADWLRELDQPEKCGPFQLFCRRWYLVVPAPAKNIVLKPTELPERWGMIEIGTGDPVIVVPAAERDAELPTGGFVRALLRSAVRSTERPDLHDGAPLVRINRILGKSASLICGHVVLLPLTKVTPLSLPCHGCLENRPTDHEYLEAAHMDETREGLERLRTLLHGRLAGGAL